MPCGTHMLLLSLLYLKTPMLTYSTLPGGLWCIRAVLLCLHAAVVSLEHLPCYLQVLVDVNWRPVFWDDHKAARGRIREYVNRADILKLSDDEAEFIYDVGHGTALDSPESVRLAHSSCP